MRYESTKKEFFLKWQGVNGAMGKGTSVGTEIQKELSGAGIFQEKLEDKTVMQSDQEDGCTTQTEQKAGPEAEV